MATLPHLWFPRLRDRPLDEVLDFNVTVMRAAKKAKAIRLQLALAQIKGDDGLSVALGRLSVLLLNLNLDG
jgi:hypothetical protein